MKAKLLLLGAAAATALVPAFASAAPGSNGATTTTTTQDSSQLGPSLTGQPNQDCEALIASGTGSDPGNSAANGSSAFGGSAGDVYAGSQPQNSKNTASVSQYDVACSKQPM